MVQLLIFIEDYSFQEGKNLGACGRRLILEGDELAWH